MLAHRQAISVRPCVIWIPIWVPIWVLIWVPIWIPVSAACVTDGHQCLSYQCTSDPVKVQVARQSAEAEADNMKAEVDAVVARQQERIADWEAAVAEEEAALAAKQQELQATIHGLCTHAPSISMGGPHFRAALLPKKQLQGLSNLVSNDALYSLQAIAQGRA